jgi:hypothetical protein
MQYLLRIITLIWLGAIIAPVFAQHITFDLWGNQFQSLSKGALASTQYAPQGAKVFNFTGDGQVCYSIPSPLAAYARIAVRHHNPLRKTIAVSLKIYTSGAWVPVGTITDTGGTWTTTTPGMVALTGAGRDFLGPRRELQIMATLPQRSAGWSVWYIDQISITLYETLAPWQEKAIQTEGVGLAGDTLLAVGESPLITGGRSPAQDRALSIRAAQVLAYQKMKSIIAEQTAGKNKKVSAEAVLRGCSVRSVEQTPDGKIKVTVQLPPGNIRR